MNKKWLAVIMGAVLIAGAGFGVIQIFGGESAPALTAKEAAQKMEERYPGSVKEIELDEDDGRWIYEVELKNGKQEAEMEIDAYTGEILFFSVEDD